jgi:hypothetical protein
MVVRIIGARFVQKCRECRRSIEVGQSIEIDSAVPGARCMVCVDPQQHIRPRRGEATTKPILPEPARRTRRTYEELFPDDD